MEKASRRTPAFALALVAAMSALVAAGVIGCGHKDDEASDKGGYYTGPMKGKGAAVAPDTTSTPSNK